MHGRARLGELQPLDDHPVAGLESLRHEPLVADGAVGDDRAQLHLVVGPDHECGRLALLVVRHRQLRHQQRVGAAALDDLLAHEHARQQQLVRVGEQRPQGHRAGRLIDRDFRKLQLAGELVMRAVLEHQVHLRLVVPGLLELPGGELALQAQQHRARLRHIDIDRVELLHRRERLRLVARHQRALGDRGAADAPGDRGQQARVHEVDARGIGRGRVCAACATALS